MTKKILCLALAVSFSASSMPVINAENVLFSNSASESGEILAVEYGSELFGDKNLAGVISSDKEVVLIDENNKAYAVGTGVAVLSYEPDIDEAGVEKKEITIKVEPKKLKAEGIKVFPKEQLDGKTIISTPVLPIADVIEGDIVYLSSEDATAEFTDEKIADDYKVAVSGLKLLGKDAGKYVLESDSVEAVGKITEKLEAKTIAGEISDIYQPEGVYKLSLPEAPEGYRIIMKSTSDSKVVAEDFCVMPHKEDKEVKIVLSVEKLENEDGSASDEETDNTPESPEEDNGQEDNEEIKDNGDNAAGAHTEGDQESSETTGEEEAESADTEEITLALKGTDKAVITVLADEGGTVEGGGSFDMGENVTLKATPKEGYFFAGWEACGEVVSKDAEHSFEAEKVMEIHARFIPESEKKITVRVEKSNENKTVEGEGEYSYGETVTLKAGSGFWYWSINGKKVSESNPYTFTATEDVAVRAHFMSSGGGSLNNNYTYCTVKFISNGGTIVEDARVAKNTTAKEPTAPVRKGYDFTGWYSDKELTKKYDFKKTRVLDDLTLYAGWKKSQQSENENPFTDIEKDAWYTEAVDFVYNNSLMLGMTDTEFKPDINLSRAMFVTVLYRLSNEKNEASGKSAFKDVADDAWYKEAVEWAVKNKIVFGYDENTFAPSDSITREQLAVMMYRFAKYSGYDMSGSADISGYKDYETVSQWAIPAVKWAVDLKIISGMDNKILLPNGTATRAQCAQILMKSIESLNLMNGETE